MDIKGIIKIILSAKGWIAVTFLGFLLWAAGASISNEKIIIAGYWAIGIGVMMSIVMGLIYKKL